MDFSWIFIVIQLIFLEGLLSIDNAAVLGAMVAPLPLDEPIPWPTWLKGIGQRMDPWLGGQQVAALKVGLLGAYVGRGLMLLVAHHIVRYPWLQVVGGIYLVYLGIEHLSLSAQEDEEEKGHFTAASRLPSFWGIVLSVEIMDLIFSLDNVVAAVALSDELWVVLLGVALGILALRWAAGFFSVMVDREPVLQHAAYVLVLVIGLRFCVEQFFDIEIHSALQFFTSVAILGLALLYAHWPPLRVFHPIVHNLRRGLHQVLSAIKRLFTFRAPVRTEVESGKE
jgi:tellurite resistance protein TerC